MWVANQFRAMKTFIETIFIVTSPKTKDLSLPLHQNYGKNHDEKLKSPMMDIFLKVGSNTKTVPVNEDELHKLEAPDSWRQTIFKSVQKRTGSDFISAREKPMSSRSPDKYRKLWQQSIDRVITLIRIEKDNARIRGIFFSFLGVVESVITDN